MRVIHVSAGGVAPIAHFMNSILQLSLHQSNAEGSLTRASAALLPMVASEPAIFLATAEGLVQRNTAIPLEAKQEFLASVQAVGAAATGRGPLNVAVKSAFEGKFHEFVESSRGFLHLK
jgi:hypothetical protein